MNIDPPTDDEALIVFDVLGRSIDRMLLELTVIDPDHIVNITDALSALGRDLDEWRSETGADFDHRGLLGLLTQWVAWGHASWAEHVRIYGFRTFPPDPPDV